MHRYLVSMNIRGNRACSHLQNQLDRYLIGLQTRKLETRRRGLSIRILDSRPHMSLAPCLKTNEHLLPSAIPLSYILYIAKVPLDIFQEG